MPEALQDATTMRFFVVRNQHMHLFVVAYDREHHAVEIAGGPSAPRQLLFATANAAGFACLAAQEEHRFCFGEKPYSEYLVYEVCPGGLRRCRGDELSLATRA